MADDELFREYRLSQSHACHVQFWATLGYRMTKWLNYRLINWINLVKIVIEMIDFTNALKTDTDNVRLHANMPVILNSR